MNKKFFRLTMALLFVCSSSFSQNNSSPDVQMLPGTLEGKSLPEIYSPNLFDGSANVTIPIFKYKGYGISLSYNTKGIRVDEVASTAGLNWQISGTPTIVRIINDIPDETRFGNTYYLVSGAYPYVNNEYLLKGKLFTYAETQQEKDVPYTYRDKECDEFRVSLNGASFSFYLGSDNKVYTTSGKNYKVQLYYNDVLLDATPDGNIQNYLGGIPGNYYFDIKITDNIGNEYYFTPSQGGFTSISHFRDWEQVGREELSLNYTTWKIKKIRLTDGKEISYSFGPGGDLQSYPGYPILQYVQYHNSYAKETNFMSTPTPTYDGSQDVTLDNEFNYCMSVDSIHYPNGVFAKFIYDTTDVNAIYAKLLDEIRISRDGKCLRYKLYHEKINGRWFLQKITTVSQDSSEEKLYYSFEYNSTVLPRRLCRAVDLYGYYNGDSTSVQIGGGSGYDYIIPKHGSQSYGSDRSYNAHYAQAGLLTRVVNTYGGETNYYYGPNVASNPFPSGFLPTDNNYIGESEPDGVRIDSIVEKNLIVPGSFKSTVFDYSGGQIFMPGGYFHYPIYIDSATNGWSKVLFQTGFLTFHQLVNGSNHGYSSVTISTYGPDAGYHRQLLSKKVVTFTNMKDATSNNLPRYYKVAGSKDFFTYPYTSKQYLKDWEIGLPLTVTDYDENNRVIQKVINNYRFSDVDLSASGYISNDRTITVNSGTEQPFNHRTYLSNWYPYQKVFTDHYFPYKGHTDLTSKIILKYISDNRYIADTIWYGYDSHHNMDSILTRKSNGDKILTRKVYNYEIDGPDIPSGNYPRPNALYSMTDAGIEEVISIERWKINPSTIVPPGFTQNNNELQSALITNYGFDNGKLWIKGLWNSSIGGPVSYPKYTGIYPNGTFMNPYWRILKLYTGAGATDSNFTESSKVTMFDSKGNSNEVQLIGANKYKTMIWDTATDQKLAEVSNCRYSDMAYTSFETTLAESNLTVSLPHLVNGGVTGSHAQYLWSDLLPGSPITIHGTQNLKDGKKYLLSFWVKGTPPSIYVGNQVIPLSSDNLMHTKGSWQNYQIQFTPNAAGKIKITGTAASSEIDEIRLFPAGAAMQSWTYDPLFGQNSSTDGSGHILYIGFDKLGRTEMQKDVDGNILSEKVFKTAN